MGNAVYISMDIPDTLFAVRSLTFIHESSQSIIVLQTPELHSMGAGQDGLICHIHRSLDVGSVHNRLAPLSSLSIDTSGIT